MDVTHTIQEKKHWALQSTKENPLESLSLARSLWNMQQLTSPMNHSKQVVEAYKNMKVWQRT